MKETWTHRYGQRAWPFNWWGIACMGMFPRKTNHYAIKTAILLFWRIDLTAKLCTTNEQRKTFHDLCN